jgi:hypothetical protein
MHPAQFLRRKQAGSYLREKWGVGSAATLAKLACLGGGPPMSYIGRRIPVYTTDDLDAWALSRISAPVRSTSDRPFLTLRNLSPYR